MESEWLYGLRAEGIIGVTHMCRFNLRMYLRCFDNLLSKFRNLVFLGSNSVFR